MAVLEGERYLVSMLGADVAWVQNVKAGAGRAVLRHGRTEQVRLEELEVEKRAPVLKAYLWEPQTGRGGIHGRPLVRRRERS